MLKILREMLDTLQKIEQKLPLTSQNQAPHHAPNVEIQRVEVPVEVIKEVVKEVPVEVVKTVTEPFATELAHYRQFCQAIAQDEALSRLLRLEPNANESQRFIQLIVNVAQWSKLEMIWQELADRCKREQRPATETELAILNTALMLFNFTTTLKASLAQPAVGESFNYQTQQRGNPTGEQIIAIWLPSLIDARKTAVKLAVVETK